MKKIIFVITVCLFWVQANEEKQGISTLSEDVRALLSQEMRQIEKGMQNIFSHIVKGEHEEIAKIATQIHDSFIFKKSLTDAQRTELKEKAPKAFIELDRTFHATAGQLAEAAEFDDKVQIQENYLKMMGLCVQCHSTYASHRFSTFEDLD